MDNSQLKARDFARPFTHVSKDEMLPQAFWTLESTDDTHLVVTQDDKPIGIISYKDFLRILTERARRKKLTRLYVSSIMTTTLITVDADTSITNTVKTMYDKGISSILVREDDSIVGIITKRDILRKTSNFDFASDPVERYMVRDPITVPLGLSITGAESLLRNKRISTLPIVEEGELVGYLDIHILARFMINMFLNPEHRHPEKVIQQTTIGEIMKGRFYVFPSTVIQDFCSEIVKRKFKGAPVVFSDANRRVVGIITETDIIRILSTK